MKEKKKAECPLRPENPQLPFHKESNGHYIKG